MADPPVLQNPPDSQSGGALSLFLQPNRFVSGSPSDKNARSAGSSPALLIGFPMAHLTALPFPLLREERERKAQLALFDFSLKQSVGLNLDQLAA
jgi:hypothetical protein